MKSEKKKPAASLRKVVISGFRRNADHTCALLDFLTLEGGKYRLSRNVGKKLPLRAA
jgi:hypothetical protein